MRFGFEMVNFGVLVEKNGLIVRELIEISYLLKLKFCFLCFVLAYFKPILMLLEVFFPIFIWIKFIYVKSSGENETSETLICQGNYFYLKQKISRVYFNVLRSMR